MKRVVMALIFILLATTVSHAAMVSIRGQQVNMRSGPGTNYPVLWELGAGFPLRTIKQQGKWLQVKDFEGDTGWVFKRLTSKTPTVIVTRKIVNIRSGPSTKKSIVGKAEYGTVLKVVTQNKGWVKIQQQGRHVGWIRKNLVWGW
ncbi:MAG: SH3 domain-containing protein [Desulfobulbaceae bacterium]|nr:SH3 domain-containing protein [Desulfobulbaceae bacterium]